MTDEELLLAFLKAGRPEALPTGGFLLGACAFNYDLEYQVKTQPIIDPSESAKDNNEAT